MSRMVRGSLSGMTWRGKPKSVELPFDPFFKPVEGNPALTFDTCANDLRPLRERCGGPAPVQ